MNHEFNTSLPCVLCTCVVNMESQGGTVGEGNFVCKTCYDSIEVMANAENIVSEVLKKITKKDFNEIAASSTLKMIFSGKLHSYRHNIYKEGGSQKKNMINFENRSNLVELLSEDQSNFLYMALGSNFRETKYNDYIYKVIVPECIVSLFAKFMQWSRIQTEVFLEKFFSARNKPLEIKPASKVSNESMKSEIMRALENDDFLAASTVISKLKASAINKGSKEVKTRRKVKCPQCYKQVAHLDRHLMSKKHVWDRIKAKNARVDFDLNLPRKVLSPSKRQSKIRQYKKQICGFSNCLKEVKRLNNHLRQFHGLKTKEEVQRATMLARPVLEISDKESNDESSSDDSSFTDDEVLLENNFTKAIHSDSNFLASDSEDDDWLGIQYLQKRLEKCSEDHIGHDLRSKRDMSPTKEDSESSSVDFEDGEQIFYMASSEEEQFLDDFVIWLQSPDGGIKPERTAKKHKNVIMGVVRHAADDDINYKHLSCTSFLNSWMLKMQSEQKQPGTIKTYLGSIQIFLDFCILRQRNDIITNDEYVKLKVLIKQWMRTLWKGIQERQYEKDLEDFHNFPSEQEIIQFDASDYVKNAKKILKSCNNSNFVLNKSNYCLARSYLLTYILFNNASRPGAIANMTIGEFRRALHNASGYTISVKKHKTSYKGPANIAMTVELYNEVAVYIQFLRNKLEGISHPTDKEPVFLSFSGLAMDSSMISSQFTLFWNRALGKKNSDSSAMNPTLVRKYTTTKVHSKFPHLKQKTAQHLCHSLKVAESNYALYDTRNSASSTCTALTSVQRSTDGVFKNVADKVDTTMDLFNDEINKGLITIADVRKKISGTDSDLKKVLDKVRHTIRKRNITAGSTPNVEKVQFSIEPRIKAIEEKDDFAGKKKKKDEPIRKLYNFRDKKESKINVNDEFFESTDDVKTDDFSYLDYIAPSPEVAFKRTRKEFAEDDNRLIYKYLSSIIFSNEPIVKSQFTSLLKSQPELVQLVKRFGVQSLIVKMRTERQKNFKTL
ncbi:uncharacterized protein LOC124815663 [Hydra vulgaris]|uniref:uncharacterized protein LOC124815663 n=1 Tax=Hydra vulgaris TaxID=6087 RepID=UPI0032EA2418